MINTTIRLMNQFGIRPQDYSSRIYVDGANPEFIRSLKHQLGERPDYEDEIKFYQSNSPCRLDSKHDSNPSTFRKRT